MIGRYAMVSFDLDGTLLDDMKTIDPPMIQWAVDYQKEGGVIVLATGRKLRESTTYAEELGLNMNKGYIVYSNGAFIYSFNKKASDLVGCITPNLTETIVKGILDISPKTQVLCVTQDTNYIVIKKHDFKSRLLMAKGAIKKTNMKFLSIDEISDIDCPIEKVRISKDSLASLYDKVYLFAKSITGVHPLLIENQWLDIYSDTTDKAYALSQIMEELKVSPDEVLVFGDDENDITTFKLFPHSVAMKNGVEDLKRISSVVINDNNTSAIYEYLKTV